MKLNRRVTIITRFSGIMFSLLLLGGLAACSDDNNGNDTPEPEPSTYPTTPFSKIELKEVIESDAQPVTATHTYLYNSAGRLTSYTGKQSFTAGDELFEIENTTTVEYKDHQAVITDEAGTVSTYTLNDYRHFLPCSRQAYKERLRAGLHTHRELYHRIISYLLLKELVEEKDVIVYGVVPIRSGMSTGTGDEVMVYLPCQQPVVQVLVHFKKEIGLTAVDD